MSWYKIENDTLTLNVLVTPNSKQTKILKPHGDELKISISTQPQKGKATKDLVKFLATEFGVKVKDIDIIYGEFTPHKQFKIKNPKKFPSVFNDL